MEFCHQKWNQKSGAKLRKAGDLYAIFGGQSENFRQTTRVNSYLDVRKLIYRTRLLWVQVLRSV